VRVPPRWFLFDLGNVVVQLDYHRVVKNLCADASADVPAMIDLLEGPGGYRDLERGLISFEGLYERLRDDAGYEGGIERLQEVWADFFAGPVPGIEQVLARVRDSYQVAFLSNSNEVHAKVIPRVFSSLFRPEDIFIFSHEERCAKPDPLIFARALEIVDAQPWQCLYVDDLAENVAVASAVGLKAILFTGAEELLRTLIDEGLLDG
jgi:glucose-1-phosphatase